jgi:2-keto-4-pentenoate hydratase/2-oxohepta-3-ene-1,7-dioic acid hydratase in catechol pathway
VFGRVIDELDSDPAFAKAFCTVVDSKTSEVSYSTKNLTDLAKGLQICHDITYRALQDKQAQAADVTGKATDASTLVLATYRALANRFDHNLSVDATAAIVQATKDARSSTDEEGAG